MDTNELFWATGIDNSGLRANQQEAIQIFTTLTNRVTAALDEITQKYGKVIAASKVKFDNPVDPSMISSIKTQIETLGKTIDMEITKLGNFTAKYDQSMTRISKSAAKLQVGNNSPLAPMVAGIQKDVASSTEQLSFLERRFKYAFGSMVAYGSVSVLKSMASEIIDVKTQFEFLQTAINSFAGSAEKGAKIMHELTQFAVNSPLQVNDITEAAKQLMAFGVGADNVVSQIKMLSDVAAGAGKPIKEIAYIYGKSLTEGKVYTRTLMQFGNLGIPIYEALAKVMDTTPDKIKKMTQMGAVGFEDVKRAIESLTAAGGQYYGFSEKMMSTTAGLLSNVKDKWILAMKDMGESSDGFINMSVGFVDTAIAHWQALGDAIAVAAAAVGSYQVAKMVVNLGNNMAATTANLAEVASLETLVSAETKAAIAKTGFVVGSEAYGKAIRKEVAALLESATAEEAAASARLDKITLKATESETTLLSASAEEAATAQENFNTVSKERNIVATELKNATKKKEILINEIDSASEIGQAAATDLVAAAKARLTAITATLTRTMVVNPYLAAGVALATLVTIVWALYDGTTAAERSQRNLGKALDDIQAKADKKSKQFSDNLDIIKNKALNGTKAQSDAYQILHDQFGAIIGDRKLEQLRLMDSVEAQNKMNKAKEYEVILGEKKLVSDKQQALYAQQEIVANASETGKGRAQIRLKEIQDDLVATSKRVNKDIEDYNKSKKGLEVKEEEDTYDHWSNLKKEAIQHVKDMGSAAMDALKAGTADNKTKEYYAKQLADEKKADEEMAKFPSEKAYKAANRAQELRNREASEAAKRLDQIRANNAELANLKSKGETDATQAIIDAMDAGYAKEKAQQENNFEKKMTSLSAEQAKMLKLEQENINNIFRNQNPNTSKTKTTAPKIDSLQGGVDTLQGMYDNATGEKTKATILASLNAAKEALNTYNSEVDSTQKDNDAKLSVLLEKQLLEYGDYTAKKTEIERKYNDTLAALSSDRERASKKGDMGLVGQIDSATIQANVNKAKDLMSLSFDQLKSTPEYSMAFEDLNNVSTETLEKLMGEMEKLKRTAAGTLSVADFKEYSKTIQNVTDKFIEKNPFKVLREEAEKLKTAQEDINSSKLELSLAQSGLKVGDTGMLAPISGVEQKIAVKVATDKVANSQNNLNIIQNNGVKAVKTITSAYGDLSKELSSVGSAIGGTAGEIISAIGDIGSFVTSAITGWKAASEGAAGALQVVEKASVILAVISAVITVATKIANIFTSASKKRAEEAQKELDSIEAVKKAYLEAYAAMNDKKFSNIFGDDVFGKATAQVGLMNQAASNYNDTIKSLEVTSRGATTMSSKWGFISKTIEGFDEVEAKAKLAMSTTSDADKKILQNLIDEYDAYKSYLDEIDSYLSGIFSSLGGNIMDSLVTDQDNLTQWTDDVTGYISDSFTKMVKDIIYQMEFSVPLATAQAKIQAAMLDKTTDNATKEKLIQDALAELNAAFATGTPAAMELWKTFQTSAAGAGFDLGGTTNDNKNSTTSAIKGMDQPTADILTAQFSAVRIHTANMDINLSKIGNNVSDLLLSLQGQAGILQIAFNDVAEIARNTRDLAGIKSILSDIKTYGVKVL